MRSLSPVCTVGDTSRLSLLLICSFRLLSSSWEAISCSLVLWYWEACVSSCFLTSISCIYDAKKHQREMNETKYQTGENKRERAKEMRPLRLDCVPAGASVPPHSRVSSGAERPLAPASQSEQSAAVWSRSQSALELPGKFIYRYTKFSKNPFGRLRLLVIL